MVKCFSLAYFPHNLSLEISSILLILLGKVLLKYHMSQIERIEE